MNPRTVAAFLHDLLATALMWLAAYWIRFNLEVPQDFLAAAFRSLLWVVPLYSTFYLAFGLYRGIWRYASMDDLRRLLVAIALGSVTAAAFALLFNMSHGIPRSVFVLHPILLLAMMAGDRYLYRAWKDGYLLGGTAGKGVPVVVLGAGDAAAGLIGDLARSSQWRVVGLFDDNAAKHGRRIGDVPIVGALASLDRYAQDQEVKHAIIAMPSATVAQRRRATELASRAGLTVFTVPTSADILAGRISISQVRKVELEDLLGREQVQLDTEGLHRLLTDKVVLVTGAGGSIGSELARQIAQYSPRLLVFYEQSEFALYAIEQEFAGRPVACAVGDVKDAAQLDAVFRQYLPEVVFTPPPTSMCR
jgi:FlaA1/EpsC-like NDP-sugar epimerase